LAEITVASDDAESETVINRVSLTDRDNYNNAVKEHLLKEFKLTHKRISIKVHGC